MLDYKIENYEHILFPSSERSYDHTLDMRKCGKVTNKDDKNFVIHICLNNQQVNKTADLPYPHFMCNSTIFRKRGAGKNDLRIIVCNKSDVDKLLEKDDNYIVALYHEIGHFHYSDEQDKKYSDDKYRWQQIKLGKVPKDEILADSFAAKALGKERVIKALQTFHSLFMMSPDYNCDEGKRIIKEFELRIAALKKDN